jgi:hypothetical protein
VSRATGSGGSPQNSLSVNRPSYRSNHTRLAFCPISFLGLGEAIPPLAKLVPTNSISIYRRNRLIFHVVFPYSIANVVTHLSIRGNWLTTFGRRAIQLKTNYQSQITVQSPFTPMFL